MNLSSKLKHPVFKVCSSICENQNIKAYVIGGYVRDFFLERDSKDIDIVVIGNALEFAELVSKKLKVKSLTVFKNYGTAHFRYKDLDIEFVGARKESYNLDSRNPIVFEGTLIDDQNRRDFTINALALALHPSEFGNLLDPFNGLNDLKEKIIRTPLDPNNTFSDDPLRMMRAIRFASQLDFRIEKNALQAIIDNSLRIKIISKERITDELNKIIMSITPSRGFNLLFSTGLLKEFFSELCDLQGVETINLHSHKDNFHHTLEVLDNISINTDNLWLRWAAILHDIAKPKTKKYDSKIGWTFHGHEDIGAKMIPKIFSKLRLPLDNKMKYVQKLVKLHLRPISLVNGNITDSAIRRLLFEAGPDIDDLMILCNADITSKNEFKVQKFKKNFDLVYDKLKQVEEKDKLRNFKLPIDGQLIMNTFSLTPCYEIGVIKNKIKDAILDGKIKNNYEEAYLFMLEIGKEMNLRKVN